jgi:hypothetical protein
VSDRIRTITMVVKIPSDDYAEVMPELLSDIERAAQRYGIDYRPPEVTR